MYQVKIIYVLLCDLLVFLSGCLLSAECPCFFQIQAFTASHSHIYVKVPVL